MVGRASTFFAQKSRNGRNLINRTTVYEILDPPLLELIGRINALDIHIFSKFGVLKLLVPGQYLEICLTDLSL